MREYKMMCPKCETEMDKQDLGAISTVPLANEESTVAIFDDWYKCRTCGHQWGFPRSRIA